MAGTTRWPSYLKGPMSCPTTSRPGEKTMIEDRIEVNIAGGLDVALPHMVNVRQKFDGAHLGDIPATVAREFQHPEVRAQVKPGQEIAVGCGSRGIANIAAITKCVIRELQALGARPFIFP